MFYYLIKANRKQIDLFNEQQQINVSNFNQTKKVEIMVKEKI